MNDQDLERRIHTLETLVTGPSLGADQRDALREEVAALQTTLEPDTIIKRWAVGGAAAGAVLPVLGLFSGGAAGAIYGVYRSGRHDIATARERLARVAALLEA